MVKNILKTTHAFIFRVEVCSFQDGYYLLEKMSPSSKYYLELKKEVRYLFETSESVYQVKRFHVQKDPVSKIYFIQESKIN